MLEYFTYKKVKKHREDKALKEEAKKAFDKPQASDGRMTSLPDPPEKPPRPSRDGDLDGDPLLPLHDQSFLESILAHSDPPPPLPPRSTTPVMLDATSDSDTPSAKDHEAARRDAKGKGKEKERAKTPNKLALLFTRHRKPGDGLEPEDSLVSGPEAEREKRDLGNVLDRLNLTAGVSNSNDKKGTARPGDFTDLVGRFTQVFKDLVNGVPTAYDDLVRLFEDRDGAISRAFDKLPRSLKKLVTQLPEKMTSSLAPEMLAAAAEAGGIEAGLASGGVKAAAKKMLTPKNLSDLVTKPGALVGMLRAILEALKARWPAFIGVNVIWSVALSLLLIMLWYCHKRGREARLERERSGISAQIEDGGDGEAGHGGEPSSFVADATSEQVHVISDQRGELIPPNGNLQV